MKNLFRISGVILVVLSIFLIHSCKKDKPTSPIITTTAISAITQTTATSGGNITDEGSSTVTTRGICWSIGTTPTIADNKTSDGAGAGSFSSNIIDLFGGTTYYVRAYATNSSGTGYGMALSFKTSGQPPSAPTVTIQNATNIQTISAQINGDVNAMYHSTSVTFEYGTTTSYGSTATATQSPIMGNTNTNVSADITGLTVATIYHYRIKAVNSLGTTYSTDLTFTTGNPIVIPIQTIVMATVPLAGASNFAILAGSKISNVPTSAITGDIGLSPAAGSFITGFGLTEVTGTIYTVGAGGPAGSVPDATRLTTAKVDLTTAYNDAAARTSTEIVTLSGNIGGLTLTPGLYKSTSSLAISSGDLTFDAKGNASAVFIIQIASALTTTSGRKVILSGGALATNIFWQVGSSATFGTTSIFKGTVLAMESITFNTGATLDGRALARTAGVTLAGNTIVKQ